MHLDKESSLAVKDMGLRLMPSSRSLPRQVALKMEEALCSIHKVEDDTKEEEVSF